MILAVATVTFRELIRARTLHGLIVVFCLISLFGLVLGELSFAEQVRLSLDFGLAAMHLCLIGLSLVFGARAVHHEIETKTIFTHLSKPIRRSHYLAGKFLGLSVLLFVVTFVFFVFLTICSGYFGSFQYLGVGTASFGYWIESLFFISLTLFLSQFLSAVVAVFCGLSLFLVGHWFETLQNFSENHSGLSSLYHFLSWVFPNLEKWNWRSLVLYGDSLSWNSFFISLGEGGLWILAYLLLAIFLFERRDLID